MSTFDSYPGEIPNDPVELMKRLQESDGRRFPHDLYNRLREVAPVWRDPDSRIVFAFRWAEADHLFRSQSFGGQEGRLASDPRFENSPALHLIASNIAFRDPPELTRLRSYAQKAFSRPVIEGVRAYLEGLTTEVLDSLADNDEIDIVNDYAIRIPPAVICHMLGIPIEDRATFEGWVADQFRLLTPLPISDETLAEIDASTRSLVEYTSSLIEERRSAPRDDLISGLLQGADSAGQRMTPQEMIAMTIVLLGGGSDTTRFVIAMGARALILDKEQGDALRADPKLDARAFEEFCRVYGPVAIGNIRRSPDDAELGGVKIPAGTWVAPVIASANLDPAVFTDPYRIDIRRNPNPHLAFGGGAHACLGMMMARMIGPYAIGRFARHFPRLDVCDAQLDVNEKLFAIRGLMSLKVRRT
ncbi:cytochrome P450 [Paraburkholderia sp. CNPSo 3281]|uniref:cytochrome P450 n=1 Tax=Paraburkholderia sp. CNPSo 3281 TaxID=2940933 RepID=UPI0020B846F3|nr:cytochrome P450 [Paraburkholderia sp. CNPSo 3281]MCP3720623.1 cytochrome P450 [Paraburkholderia sp. CNPSo 3281]